MKLTLLLAISILVEKNNVLHHSTIKRVLNIFRKFLFKIEITVYLFLLPGLIVFI